MNIDIIISTAYTVITIVLVFAVIAIAAIANSYREDAIDERSQNNRAREETIILANKRSTTPTKQRTVNRRIQKARRRHCERHELQYPYGKPGRKSQ